MGFALNLNFFCSFEINYDFQITVRNFQKIPYFQK